MPIARTPRPPGTCLRGPPHRGRLPGPRRVGVMRPQARPVRIRSLRQRPSGRREPTAENRETTYGGRFRTPPGASADRCTLRADCDPGWLAIHGQRIEGGFTASMPTTGPDRWHGPKRRRAELPIGGVLVSRAGARSTEPKHWNVRGDWPDAADGVAGWWEALRALNTPTGGRRLSEPSRTPQPRDAEGSPPNLSATRPLRAPS